LENTNTFHVSAVTPDHHIITLFALALFDFHHKMKEFETEAQILLDSHQIIALQLPLS
jgi:hypothetical protein